MTKNTLDAIIFHSNDAATIKECILKPLGYNNIKILNKKFYNIKILFYFIRNLRYIQLKYYPFKLIAKLRVILYYSIIIYYNPKLVISIIDDDSGNPIGHNVPLIGGKIPDLYGHSYKHGIKVIGEAKTSNDIIKTRTENQLKAYLKFLSAYKNKGYY